MPSAVVAIVYAISHGARLAGWLALAGVYVGWLALGLTGVRDLGTPWQELRWAGLALLLGGFAELVDNRRQRVAAFRRLYAEEQRRREEERRLREEQERLRMARELHDVLAHSLSLIAVRASVALELMDSDPAEVRKALVAIKEASKGGLDEVRTVLSGLRDPAPRSPAPSLDRLDELVSESLGLTVTLTRTGLDAPLPSAVSLAGYRVVQEALTNVIRHSRARSAVVHLHQTSQLLLIGVSDSGPAASGRSASGSGLIGIAERVSALGGVAQAGPDPAGGFTVHVALPLTGDGR
jgi:signal transduction histidine kinase